MTRQKLFIISPHILYLKELLILVLFRFLEEIIIMEISEAGEEVVESIAVSKVNLFLKAIGLETPLDYLFLDHAMSMHQSAVMKNDKITLQFLFQLMIGKEENDKNFPYSSFLEKIIFRYADPEAETATFREIPRFIVSHFVPSAQFKEKKIQSFSDFHLYYLDILKPITKQSAEELYALIDSKKDETFFLVFGNRQEDPFIVVLFFYQKLITTFHVLPFESSVKDVGHVCKWIHSEIPTFQRQVFEYGVFQLPDTNLVLTDKGVEIRKQQWQEAFGNENIMDMEDIPDLISRVPVNDEVCESCSS